MRYYNVLLYLLPLTASVLGACSSSPVADFSASARADLQQLPAWSQSVSASDTLAVDGAKVQLTDLLRDAQLQALIGEALAANPDLQQTLLTLTIRQANQRQSRAGLLPSVQAGLNGSKEQHSDKQYSGSLTVSWEADLWQKLANGYQAAGKDVAQQRALYQAARDTLAAQVMKSWLALIAGRHALEIEQQRLTVLEQNVAFIVQRYRQGLGSLEQLDGARSSVASSRATLAKYQESLAQQQRDLQLLLGRGSMLTVELPADYPQVLTPLADLPQQSLQRRPDLQAAYLAIEAADLRAKVAYKSLLPSISLQAALQDVAASPRAALLTDPVWSLLAQLTAPLYQGGQLRAEADIAELETAQTYQAYRETLLTAVNEVDNALGQEQALATQQLHIASALASARNNLRQYQRSYRSGLVDILDLLNVQQQTYDLEAQLDTLIHNRLANRIDIGLALGLGVSE